MSGVEEAVAISAISAAVGVAGTAEASRAGQAQKERAVRNQMVQQRLKATERNIQEEEKLSKTLAKRQVASVARGFAPGAGTPAAFTQIDFENLARDENLNALNLQSEEMSLQDKISLSKMHRNSSIFNSVARAGEQIGESALEAQRIPSTTGERERQSFNIGDLLGDGET